jgi:hypothetical protein
MNQSEIRLAGRVTGVTATTVTVTPSGDSWDGKGAGAITTVTIGGSGLNAAGWRLNEPIHVRVSTA